jgi:hypothetical protein
MKNCTESFTEIPAVVNMMANLPRNVARRSRNSEWRSTNLGDLKLSEVGDRRPDHRNRIEDGRPLNSVSKREIVIAIRFVMSIDASKSRGPT